MMYSSFLMQILKRVIDVSENEAETQIQVQSTMPVTCLPQFDDACSVTLELAHDKDYQTKRCVGETINDPNTTRLDVI